VFLETLQRWTQERRSDFEARGVEVILSTPSETDKPGQCVVLRRAATEAEVCVWISGECEAAIGSADEVEQVHHDLQSESELVDVLNTLAARLLARAA
jgi:phage-related protein